MTDETVLVCVTGQRMCERLIQRGAEVAQEHQLPLLVLSVVGNGQNSLGDPAVAEMTVLCSEKPLDTIVDFAHKHAVAHVVIGEGKPDVHGNSFAGCLAMALPLAVFHAVSAA